MNNHIENIRIYLFIYFNLLSVSQLFSTQTTPKVKLDCCTFLVDNTVIMELCIFIIECRTLRMQTVK